MESTSSTSSAPKNRRVVRTGCRLSDDVFFRCRGRGTGRFHVEAKWQLRGKCGLGKVANIDWHEISAFEIKNTTIRPGSTNAKIACGKPFSFYF